MDRNNEWSVRRERSKKRKHEGRLLAQAERAPKEETPKLASRSEQRAHLWLAGGRDVTVRPRSWKQRENLPQNSPEIHSLADARKSSF